MGKVDDAGMQKNRLQLKRMKYSSEKHDTYFIRPRAGRSSPGIKCPESLSMRISDLTVPGAPCCFIHGTQRESILIYIVSDCHAAPMTPARRGA
eukprot:8462684-Pyramimonas_sp.AAC.1